MQQGDTVEFGNIRLDVIHLVGHTPGSIALLYDDPEGTPHLWTGDSLFPGGVGNTFGDKEAFATLIDEVETKVFDRLPDETWFYPGHGNDSVLGNERPHLAGVARAGLVSRDAPYAPGGGAGATVVLVLCPWRRARAARTRNRLSPRTRQR